MTSLHRTLLGLASVVVAAGCSGAKSDVPSSGDAHVPYPGGEAPLVRILLSGPNHDRGAAVTVRGSWTLRRLDGTELASGVRLEERVDLAGASWTLGALRVPREGAVLAPQREGDLTVGTRRYPGTLRIARSLDGTYRLSITTDMPTYLCGVVSGEVPADFPTESQRVQAIIARTYALSRAPQAFHGDPILVSDSGRTDQEYHGLQPVASHRTVAERAVRSTRGMTVVDHGAPVHAWYHSTCGGHTCPAGPVFGVETTRPLAGVPCDNCRASKYYAWQSAIAADDVVRAAGLSGTLTGFSVTATTSGGRATEFEVTAGGRSRRVEAGAFRLSVGPSRLRSTLVESSEIRSAALLVSGKGWGHGVGLCQMGAKGLAERGRTAEQILAAYYPGAKVAQLW